jgi:hypothetical protein
MIIAIKLKNFILNDCFFLDTKRNIIIDGNFTKLFFSNKLFTMNGLYFIFPIEPTTIEHAINKKQMKFNPYSPNNLSIIQNIADIEYKILDYYRQLKNCNNCTISNILSKQLYCGYMKIYKKCHETDELNNLNNKKYIIKISGIWENNYEIGLTYKLYEISELDM